MSENSKIEWTDHTFNPWEGCQKVGPGCDHCYAETRNARFAGGVAVNWGPGAPRRRTSEANWRKPLAWNAAHDKFFAAHGRRQRVFCSSLADVFDNAVDPAWREDLLELIASTPNLDWLLLTKRIGNVWGMVPVDWLCGGAWPAHVWLGATIVNQAEADRDIPKLLEIEAPVRFLSMEPLLGPVTIRQYLMAGKHPGRCSACGKGHGFARCPNYGGVAARREGQDGCNGFVRAEFAIDWVIAGGESGPGARPMHPDWARSLRDQCVAAGVPFLFKQWGEHSLAYDRERDDPDWRRCGDMDRRPGRWINLAGGHGFHGERVHFAERVGKKAAGRLLDGAQHDGFPGVEL